MKICVLGGSHLGHIQRWCQWFAQRGHKTILISTGKTQIKDVDIFHLNKKRGYFNVFFRIIKTIRFIHKLKPDIINAHYAVGTETIAAALSLYHPFVVSVWGSDISIDPEKSPLYKILVKFVIHQADLIHTGDEYGKERLIELGCNEKKIIVQLWGIDLKLFQTDITPLEKQKKFLILSANNWFRYRNVDILLKAIPTVIKEIKDISFLFIGEGPLENELKNLALQLDIQDYVIFRGKIPHADMPKYLVSSDIVVDTDKVSDNAGGGIGVTNLEAMACGVPLLLGERKYLKKVGKSLQDEPWYCSVVYDPTDPQDLGKKIIMLLKDENMRKKISEKETQIAWEIGDWNKTMETIEQTFLNEVKKNNV